MDNFLLLHTLHKNSRRNLKARRKAFFNLVIRSEELRRRNQLLIMLVSCETFRNYWMLIGIELKNCYILPYFFNALFVLIISLLLDIIRSYPHIYTFAVALTSKHHA